MREVDYTDSDGRKFLVRIPEESPDSHAKYGIVVGPPDLSNLHLPKEIEVRLNNQLFNRRIFTLREALGKRRDVLAALQSTLALDTDIIINCYRGY